VELTSVVLGIMCGLHRRNHCARFIKEARGLPVSLKHCHPSSEMDLSIWIIPFNFVPHYQNYPTTPINLGLCQQSLSKTRCTIHDQEEKQP